MNKLLSMTWLLWAPRNFFRFTLHTLKDILKFFVIQQKNTNGNIETKLLIIIPINIYIYKYFMSWWRHPSVVHQKQSQVLSCLSLSDIRVMFLSMTCTRYIHKRIYKKLDVKTSLLCQKPLQNRVLESG